jgi:hypothetical protein
MSKPGELNGTNPSELNGWLALAGVRGARSMSMDAAYMCWIGKIET